MLRIVGSILCFVGSGRRSIVHATNGSHRVGGCNPLLTCSPKSEPKFTVTCSTKTESKVQKKFGRNSSIPMEICLSKSDNIQFHQYIEMSQDLNPNPRTCSSLVTFMHWPFERKVSIFLVLRSKNAIGKCTKLHTVALSNNRDPCRAHSISACCTQVYMGVVLHEHPVRGE